MAGLDAFRRINAEKANASAAKIEGVSIDRAWVAVDDLDMSIEFLGERFSSWDGSDTNPGLPNFVHTPRSYEGIKQSGVKDKVLSYL